MEMTVLISLLLCAIVFYFLGIKPILVFFQQQDKTLHVRLNRLSLSYLLSAIIGLLVSNILAVTFGNADPSFLEIIMPFLVSLLVYFANCTILSGILWVYNLFYYSYYFFLKGEKKNVL